MQSYDPWKRRGSYSGTNVSRFLLSLSELRLRFKRLTVPNGHIDKKVESPKKTDNIKGNLQCSKLCEDKVVQPMNGTYNCKRCRKACLPHELVERAGSFYHRNCVRCAVCNQLVSISDRWWINGTPHCEKHFMQRYHNDALKAKAYMHATRHPVFVRNSKPIIGVSKDIPNETHFNPTTGRVVTSAVIRPQVIPVGVQSPNASSQSTIDDSGNSPPGRIPRSQSYDHISHQRTKPVSHNLHVSFETIKLSSYYHFLGKNSRVIIEYQCHVCGAIIPAGQCLTYASQIYHESCARCKVCRASSREEKLFLHHKELYCGLHLGDIKRDEILQLPNSK
ncbi:LIM domain protein, partial [Opisthorchis viverrini]